MESLIVDKLLQNIKERPTLVHCITNYVTANDVANVILAIGASPIMAEDIHEVEEITEHCTSLVLNMGTLNKNKLEAMILAGKRANVLGHPVILDPVGAGASKFRREAVQRLLKEVKFSVIRGNVSEIKTVCEGTGTALGVDVSQVDATDEKNIDDLIHIGRKLSKETNAVIVVTGAVDLVVNKDKAVVIYNGTPEMARITGTGCMMNGILGSFAGANQEYVFEAAVTSVITMGVSGEYAQKKSKGTSSFRMNLIDEISNITSKKIERGKKIESKF